MKFSVLAIDKASPKSPEMQLFADYAKRLPHGLAIKEFVVKKNLPPPERKREEGKLLLEAARNSHRIVALDGRGKALTSERLAAQIGAWQQQGYSSLAFLIGGADGHGPEILKAAHLTLSLGALTWPHLLVRAMLAEQLYRAHTILTHHPYHRA